LGLRAEGCRAEHVYSRGGTVGIRLADLGLMRPSGSCPEPSCDGDPEYDRHYAFNADGCINITDVLQYKPIMLTECTPQAAPSPLCHLTQSVDRGR
jgi:hypothetical protein